MKHIYVVSTYTSVFACMYEQDARELSESIDGRSTSMPIVESRGYEALDKSGIGYVWVLSRFGTPMFACQTEEIASEMAKAIDENVKVEQIPFIKKVNKR